MVKEIRLKGQEAECQCALRPSHHRVFSCGLQKLGVLMPRQLFHHLDPRVVVVVVVGIGI